jgi:hypothetical protein
VLIGDVSDLAKYTLSLKLRMGESYRPAVGTGEDAAAAVGDCGGLSPHVLPRVAGRGCSARMHVCSPA